jgi:hypothetical protein
VPALCVICHNGNLTNATPTGDANGNLITSRFIPFDLDSFRYPSTIPRTAPGVEDEFKKLNRKILSTNASTAVRQLIQNRYGTDEGDVSLSLNFDGSKVPGGVDLPHRRVRDL